MSGEITAETPEADEPNHLVEVSRNMVRSGQMFVAGILYWQRCNPDKTLSGRSFDVYGMPYRGPGHLKITFK